MLCQNVKLCFQIRHVRPNMPGSLPPIPAAAIKILSQVQRILRQSVDTGALVRHHENLPIIRPFDTDPLMISCPVKNILKIAALPGMTVLISWSQPASPFAFVVTELGIVGPHEWS